MTGPTESLDALVALSGELPPADVVLLACVALPEVVAEDDGDTMLELELPALVDAPLDTFEVEGEPPVVSGTESVPELVPECGETVTVGVVVMVSAVPLPFVEQATSSAKQLDTTQAAELRRAVRRVRLEVTQ